MLLNRSVIITKQWFRKPGTHWGSFPEKSRFRSVAFYSSGQQFSWLRSGRDLSQKRLARYIVKLPQKQNESENWSFYKYSSKNSCILKIRKHDFENPKLFYLSTNTSVNLKKVFFHFCSFYICFSDFWLTGSPDFQLSNTLALCCGIQFLWLCTQRLCRWLLSLLTRSQQLIFHDMWRLKTSCSIGKVVPMIVLFFM